MSRLFRIALACLLALALPVQGQAAYSMRFCGPSHDEAIAAAAAHDQAQHDHAQHGQVQHEFVQDQSSATAHADKSPAHGKCSACAACCGVAAIPPSPLSLAVVPVTSAYDSAPAPLRVGRNASGLERPPKTDLA